MTTIDVFTMEDLPQVQSLLREAFWRLGKSETFNEWTFARKMINDPGYIPQLCMTAKEGRSVCGYILLSHASAAGGPAFLSKARYRQGVGTQRFGEGP